jgi:hypothetical protein
VTAHTVHDNTILTDEELKQIEAGVEAARTSQSEYIVAAKRVHVIKSDWLDDWYWGFGKDESCSIEGPANHWRWLALILLGLVKPEDAPFDEQKEAPEPILGLLATIRAQRAGLEFYADPANYRHTHDWHGQMIVEPSAVDEDGGKRARSILHPKREEATRA